MSFDLKINRGDLVIDNGGLKTVVDSEKLIQDILKICLTSSGSNPIHPWYGSMISRTIVGSAIDISILVQVSKSQLTTALDNLKELQNLQIKSFQRVTPDEQIAAISNLSIVQNQADPRWFDIRIRVFSKGSKPVTTSFRISTI